MAPLLRPARVGAVSSWAMTRNVPRRPEASIAETRPDFVIVTTVDATHDEYIVAGMEAGCDVISEKPMTTTAQKIQRIHDTQKRTGKKLRVTFNYRYSPPRTQVKDILMSGEIGEVLSVDFHWLLNTQHGADYFRRWHANKANSGGLVIHKASHHFDLVNWWLDADPVEVVASGDLKVYGKNNPFRHTHCRPCPHKDQCRFHYDMTRDATRMKLYASAEGVDGYHRDGCVFREDVNIFDSMSAIVKYTNGVTMSYALDAHLPQPRGQGLKHEHERQAGGESEQQHRGDARLPIDQDGIEPASRGGCRRCGARLGGQRS